MHENLRSMRVYFETSHGKSRSDSLGGVVKGYVTGEMAAKNAIRNPKELIEFCEEKLGLKNSEENKMLKRTFLLCQKMI